MVLRTVDRLGFVFLIDKYLKWYAKVEKKVLLRQKEIVKLL